MRDCFEEANCSYYGSLDEDVKPTQGVHVFMLDEHIKGTIEKEKDRFSKHIQHLIDNFNKTTNHLLESLTKKLDAHSKDIKSVNTYIDKIIKHNKLKNPPVIDLSKKSVKTLQNLKSVTNEKCDVE